MTNHTQNKLKKQVPEPILIHLAKQIGFGDIANGSGGIAIVETPSQRMPFTKKMVKTLPNDLKWSNDPY